MPSQNVKTFQTAHQAFNKRDYNTVLKMMRDDFTYHDHARDQTYKGHDGFKEIMTSWVSAFSDVEISRPRYLDAGDVVIAEFIGRGTNDGPLGTLPKTGQRLEIPLCEILHFDAQGRIAKGSVYYDQLSMMMQLGHAEHITGVSTG